MTAQPDTRATTGPRSKPWWWISSGVMLAIAVVPWIPSSDSESDAPEVVTAYLEAARLGDIETALDLAGSHPKGEEARFLAPDAVSDEWRLVDVDELLYDDGEYDDEHQEQATVEATIETTAGDEATASFEMTRAHGQDWKISDPFVTVNIGPSLLWYTDVNGVTAPYPDLRRSAKNDEVAEFATYLLLPGAYRFYADVPDIVTWRDEKPASTPLLSGDHHVDFDDGHTMDQVTIPQLRLSTSGQKAVATAMRDYIDGCADIAATAVAGCPFGVERVPDPRDDDYYLDTLKKIEWSVTEYPTLTAVAGTGSVAITDRRRGTAELTVLGVETEDSPGTPVEATIACDIDTSRLAAGILPDGTTRIYPQGMRFQLDDFDRDPILWETCDR